MKGHSLIQRGHRGEQVKRMGSSTDGRLSKALECPETLRGWVPFDSISYERRSYCRDRSVYDASEITFLCAHGDMPDSMSFIEKSTQAISLFAVPFLLVGIEVKFPELLHSCLRPQIQ